MDGKTVRGICFIQLRRIKPCCTPCRTRGSTSPRHLRRSRIVAAPRHVLTHPTVATPAPTAPTSRSSAIENLPLLPHQGRTCSDRSSGTDHRGGYHSGYDLMGFRRRVRSSTQQARRVGPYGTNNRDRAAASAAAVGGFFPAGGVVSVVSRHAGAACAGAGTVFPRSATASLLWWAASRLGNAGGAVSAEHHRAGRHPRRADAGLLGEPSHLADFAPAGAPEMLRHHSVSHGRRPPLLIAPG